MTTAAKVLQRFDALLSEASDMQASRVPAHEVSERKDAEKGMIEGWFASCEDLLARVFGPQVAYTVRFTSVAEQSGAWLPGVLQCRGILEAARQSVAGGYLFDVQMLASAEVFADLLEMAEYLHEQQGFHIPAATLAGGVLEDTLRKICGRHQVGWEGDSSISKLNAELYKAKVFTKSEFGEIEGWGKLRNEVDHHDFQKPEDVDPSRVQRMIEGVRHLVVKWLT